MTGEMATIYALIDPRTDEVRYIGQTRHTLELRLAGHKTTALNNTYGNNGLKTAWLQELYYAGLAPEIRALKTVPVAQARTAERDTAVEYLAKGAPLFNSVSHMGHWRFPVTSDRAIRVVVADVTPQVYTQLAREAGHPVRIGRVAGELIEEALRHRAEARAVKTY